MERRPTRAREPGPRKLLRSGPRPVLAALFALALVSTLIAGTAYAAEPAQSEIEGSLHLVNPTACPDFGIQWDISTSGLLQSFFDDSGVRTSALVHIKEHNILTNLSTGKTVEDDPVYEERAVFADDGSYTVDIMGMWVNAHEGGDRLTDVGRVTIAVSSTGDRTWLFAAGQHPFREVAGDDLVADMAAFCDLLG